MALQQIPNYGINVPDAGAAFEQGIQMRQQYEARQLQQQEAENIKRDIGALGARPTVAAITDLITKYPQLSERFKAKLGQLSDEEKQNRLAIATPIYAAMQNGNPDVAKSLLKQQADARRNSGDEKGARDAEAQIKLIELDPGTATTSFGVTLAGIMGPESFKSTFGELREQALAPAKLQEAAAKAKNAATGSGIEVHSVKVYPNGTTVVIGKANEKQITNARGDVLMGADADAAVQAGLNSEIRLAGGRAGAEAMARGTAEAVVAPVIAGGTEAGRAGVQAGNAALQTATKISGQLANLRRARELAKGGADTGVIASRLPNWSASSIELANMRNQLGLDVIGQATFGTLSEGELNLALNTALPTNLNEADLVTWIDSKIAAQEKMRSEMMKAAKFLSKPGNTLDKWLEQNGGAPAGAAPAANAPPANLLREGTVTLFQNGQQWTLRGGQPVQVK